MIRRVTSRSDLNRQGFIVIYVLASMGTSLAYTISCVTHARPLKMGSPDHQTHLVSVLCLTSLVTRIAKTSPCHTTRWSSRHEWTSTPIKVIAMSPNQNGQKAYLLECCCFRTLPIATWSSMKIMESSRSEPGELSCLKINQNQTSIRVNACEELYRSSAHGPDPTQQKAPTSMKAASRVVGCLCPGSCLDWL